MNTCRLLALAIAGLGCLLTACGTTSSLTSAPEAAGSIDLTVYSRLLVTDFVDEATGVAAPEDRPVVKAKVEAARRQFPDQIASTVSARGGFTEVARAEALAAPDTDTLVMRGAITQWDDGDVTLRLLVGFGAGNARFNARIELVDGGTGAALGSWFVDKNSWALGGALGAAQSPETFLPGAAKRIGEELSGRRIEGSIRKPGKK